MNVKEIEGVLAKIRSICGSLPEFHEIMAWGHPTFRAGKKMFAGFGPLDGELVLGLNVGHDRQDELLKDKRFFPTPYAAHRGWVSMYIDRKTNWEQVARLLHEAYRRVALKRMLTALDDKSE